MDRIIESNPWGHEWLHILSDSKGFLPGTHIPEYPEHPVLGARGIVAKQTDAMLVPAVWQGHGRESHYTWDN